MAYTVRVDETLKQLLLVYRLVLALCFAIMTATPRSESMFDELIGELESLPGTLAAAAAKGCESEVRAASAGLESELKAITQRIGFRSDAALLGPLDTARVTEQFHDDGPQRVQDWWEARAGKRQLCTWTVKKLPANTETQLATQFAQTEKKVTLMRAELDVDSHHLRLVGLGTSGATLTYHLEGLSDEAKTFALPPDESALAVWKEARNNPSVWDRVRFRGIQEAIPELRQVDDQARSAQLSVAGVAIPASLVFLAGPIGLLLRNPFTSRVGDRLPPAGSWTSSSVFHGRSRPWHFGAGQIEIHLGRSE